MADRHYRARKLGPGVKPTVKQVLEVSIAVYSRIHKPE
jgi:hypothetical protein